MDYWSVGIILFELIVGEPPFYSESIVQTYQRIKNHEKELVFPENIEMSDAAKDLIRKLLSAPDSRLGRNGAAEVKEHAFFKNSKWTFETIRITTPPFVPQLSSDDDTSNFEDVTSPRDTNTHELQIPKAFNGNQLPFIGFTYSNELSPALAVQFASAKAQESLSEEESDGSSQIRKDLETSLLKTEQKLEQKQKEYEEKSTEVVELRKELKQVICSLEEEKKRLTEQLAKSEGKLVDFQKQLKQDETNGNRQERNENVSYIVL